MLVIVFFWWQALDCFFFFFKQKTAYELRISDWSSDVCSSDLTDPAGFGSRAVVGKHRVKLVEKPDPALSDHFMQSLIAAEMMFDDPESVRARIEAAGFPVLRERTFSSGRQACYFGNRSEEHTSELQSLMRISYDVFCLKKK